MSFDSENKPINDALDKIADFSQALDEAICEIKNNEEAYWASLSVDQQMAAFNCVIRRLYDGEINQQRSYRGMLYDVFGFGPDAYVRAQMAGFMEIHNAIKPT